MSRLFLKSVIEGCSFEASRFRAVEMGVYLYVEKARLCSIDGGSLLSASNIRSVFTALGNLILSLFYRVRQKLPSYTNETSDQIR